MIFAYFTFWTYYLKATTFYVIWCLPLSSYSAAILLLAWHLTGLNCWSLQCQRPRHNRKCIVSHADCALACSWIHSLLQNQNWLYLQFQVIHHYFLSSLTTPFSLQLNMKWIKDSCSNIKNRKLKLQTSSKTIYMWLFFTFEQLLQCFEEKIYGLTLHCFYIYVKTSVTGLPPKCCIKK